MMMWYGTIELWLLVLNWQYRETISTTRMHSSRMRTVCYSGHLSYHARTRPLPHMPLAMHAPPAMHAPTTHAPCHACPPATHVPPLDRILDTRLWKHYLSATTVADGNHSLWIYSKGARAKAERDNIIFYILGRGKGRATATIYYLGNVDGIFWDNSLAVFGLQIMPPVGLNAGYFLLIFGAKPAQFSH